MKNETVAHELFIEVGFSDLYTWVKNYCKEKQFVPDAPKIDKRMIKTGSDTAVGVNYSLNWKNEVSQDLRVEKSTIVFLSPQQVLTIIKDAVISSLNLVSQDGYDWVILKPHWNWQNGASGTETIFDCNLKLSKKETV